MKKMQTEKFRWTGQVSLRKLSAVLAVIYVLGLLPVFAIARYNYASADDFGMGLAAYRAFSSTGNIFAAIGQGFYMAWYDYLHWMGYFTSTVFMSVPPNVFDERLYPIGVFLLIFVLTAGTLYFFRALFVKAWKIDKYASHCLALVTLLVTVQCMPEGSARVESFFWYCSGVNYVLLYSFGLFWMGLLISAVFDQSRGKRIYDLVMACILGFAVGGGNYMTSLSCAVIAVLVIIAALRCRHKELLAPCLFLLFGFALSCLAPGNNNRAQSLQGFGAVKTILIALYYTLSYCVNEYTTWAVLLFFALAAVIAWKAAEKVSFRFSYPALAVIFGYGMVSANIAPPLYAEGNIGAGRLVALFYMQYVLVAVLLEVYVVGWLRQYVTGGAGSAAGVCGAADGQDHLEEAAGATRLPAQAQGAAGGAKLSAALSGVSIFLMAALIFGSALTVKADPDFYMATCAAQDLLNGHAARYKEQNDERRKILRDASVKDAVLDEFDDKPDLLFFSDIETDSSNWQNKALARYYGKDSVVLRKTK